MTCRHEPPFRAALAILLALAAASCGDDVGGDSADPLVAARASLDARQPIAAEALLHRALDTGTLRAAVAAQMGEASLQRGDLAAAHEWLDAGDFAPDQAALGWRMRGRLAMAEGALPQAGQFFDRARSAGGETSALWTDVARLRYRGGEQAQALDAAEKAVRLGPGNADALVLRGQLARDAAGPAAALDWFARAAAARPGDAKVIVEYAATLGEAGRVAAALEVLRNGEGEGDEAEGGRRLTILAVMAARAGNFELARDLYRRTDEANRTTAAGMLLGAVIDFETGNSADAARTLERLARRQPDNPRVRDMWAAALARSGGARELVERFAALTAGGGGSAYLATLVGRAYEELDDRAAAARFLDLAKRPQIALVTLAPDVGGNPALRERDRVRSAVGSAAGLAAARALLARYPGSADAATLAGDAALSAGRNAEASEAYARAAKIRQPWPLVRKRMITAASPSASLAILEAALRGNPRNGEAAALLGDAYAARGDWKRSVLFLDHALANGMDSVAWVLAARSVASRRTGDAETALAYALAARDLQPMSVMATEALLAALPGDEAGARSELAQKLASLRRR